MDTLTALRELTLQLGGGGHCTSRQRRYRKCQGAMNAGRGKGCGAGRRSWCEERSGNEKGLCKLNFQKLPLLRPISSGEGGVTGLQPQVTTGDMVQWLEPVSPHRQASPYACVADGGVTAIFKSLVNADRLYKPPQRRGNHLVNHARAAVPFQKTGP